MEYIFRGIISFLVKGISSAMDILGVSVLSLLSLDIGSSGSVFDIVFASFGRITLILQTLAFGLVIIISFIQITKMMFSADGGQETPYRLLAGCVLATFLIYNGGPVILAVQRYFNVFYKYILTIDLDGAAVDAAFSFSGCINAIHENLTSSNGAEVIANDVGSIGALFLVLLFTVILAWQLLMYIIEVVERYVVLGVLYYTCPLAFAMTSSKSTVNVFISWVRMLGSQMVLMIFNIIFFRLFIVGFNHYFQITEQLKAVHPEQSGTLSITFVWCIILYAILYVGTRLDTYMGALGLSTAQTGQGLGAAIVASALVASRTFQGVRAAGQKVWGSKGGRAARSAAHTLWDKTGGKATDLGKESPSFSAQTGATSGDSIIRKMQGDNIANTKNGRAAFTGAAAAQGFRTSVSAGASPTLLNRMDGHSFQLSDEGKMTMQYRGPNGSNAAVNVVPLAGNNAKANFDTSSYQGRLIELKGEAGQSMKCFMTAHGPGAMDVLTHNPAMDTKMAEYNASPNNEAKMIGPGRWQTITHNPDGTIQSAKEYSAASVYPADPYRNSHVETIGDMQYHVSDIARDISSPDSVDTVVRPGMTSAETRNAFASQFNVQATAHNVREVCVGVGGMSDAIGYCDSTTGKYFVGVPEQRYTLADQDATATPVRAANGAQYIFVESKQSYDAAAGSFVKRSGQSAGFGPDLKPRASDKDYTPTSAERIISGAHARYAGMSSQNLHKKK